MAEEHRGTLSSNVDKNRVLRKRKSRSKSDDDLSDINDDEITGYLNNKTEMLFKKFIWEAMNKGYQKKQRKPVTRKKPTSAKTIVARRMEKGKDEEKENKKRPSSKINYDALEKLTDEPIMQLSEIFLKFNYVVNLWRKSPKRLIIDSNCNNQIETHQSKGISSLTISSGFEEDNYGDEFELENVNLYSIECGYGEDYEYEEY
ncbi:hypothetical protein REPUB_Repub13aG0204300 [Reevesia pubescens]